MAATESFGDLAEHVIAGGVAPGVIDVLEAVEIDEQHGGPGPAAERPGQGLVDPVDEQGTVR